MARPRPKPSRADRSQSSRDPARAKSEIPGPYRAYRELGRRVDQLIRDKDLSRRAAAREVAKARRMNPNEAVTAHLAFQRLTPADLQRLSTLRDGRPLAITYLKRLAMVPDPAMRQELIEELGAQNWTSDDLSTVIRILKGEAAERSGRPVRQPRSLAEGLLQISSRTRHWMVAGRIWESAHEDWMRVQEPPVDPGERERVITELRELAKYATDLADRLTDSPPTAVPPQTSQLTDEQPDSSD